MIGQLDLQKCQFRTFYAGIENKALAPKREKSGQYREESGSRCAIFARPDLFCGASDRSRSSPFPEGSELTTLGLSFTLVMWVRV